MKNIITNLNKSFDNRIRLGIMSILMVNDWTDFKTIKGMLELTDGNLASHAASLEKIGYLTVKKEFIGRKPNTSYAATTEGKKAFSEHLDALEQLLKNNHRNE